MFENIAELELAKLLAANDPEGSPYEGNEEYWRDFAERLKASTSN
jgi:hypothetical protein